MAGWGWNRSVDSTDRSYLAQKLCQISLTAQYSHDLNAALSRSVNDQIAAYGPEPEIVMLWSKVEPGMPESGAAIEHLARVLEPFNQTVGRVRISVCHVVGDVKQVQSRPLREDALPHAVLR